MTKFFEDIIRFNRLYKMQDNDKPQNLGYNRLVNFVSILTEELEEHEAILPHLKDSGIDSPEAMVKLADLLGDLIVYCASEGRRWGIDMEAVLDAIMTSNFSKLNPDGTASYDIRGKLLKGVNFKAPESLIKKVLYPED